MAKKFVDVVGLHNVFETNESQLDISTIRDSAKDRADNYSILFITADDTDSTYGYDSGSRWIWTNGKLYDCNNSKYSIIPITYDELKQLRDTNMLAPGQQYRITDYVTTVANYNNAWSAGHPFDIIVTADSNNKLNEDARAIQREGDEYFKESKLESWELKYCLDNDSTRFDWAADEASGLIPVEKKKFISLPTSADWYFITYGAGKFVAVAWNSNIAAYLTDGSNWTQTTLPVSTNWWSVTYGDGKFVAVARDSNIAAYSTDGINWTQVTLPNSSKWTSITYGAGKFVVVAQTSNIAAYSTDGINWTQVTLPISNGWWYIAYGDGKFVAVAYSSNIAAYSTDGSNWEQVTLPTSADWRFIAYGNGKFVVVTGDSDIVAYSTDGINWTQTTLPNSSNWTSITYGNGKFVVVAGDSNTAAYSTDGINWTKTTLPVFTRWQSVTYGDGKFVAVTYGSNTAAYSTDGINWTRDYTYTDYETTTVPSKGVIYYMKDEFENECSYDFKNVLYKRFKITKCDKHPGWIGTYHGMLDTSYETVDENDYKWYYTFSLNDSEDTDDIRDGSLFSTTNNIYKQNKISTLIPTDSSNQRSLNDIVYRCLSGEQDDCYGNVFDVNCHHATLGMSWSRSVRAGSNNTYFSCGNNCDNWSTGNNCYKWLIGDNCDNWSTGNNCYEWFCGGGCEDWSTGNDCNNWSVGNNCYGWSCGNNVIDWMFGDGVNNKSYCANITIDSGCKCFYLTSSNTTSASLPLTNIHVMSGVKGATSNPLLINIPDVGADYTIEINKNKKTISL